MLAKAIDFDLPRGRGDDGREPRIVDREIAELQAAATEVDPFDPVFKIKDPVLEPVRIHCGPNTN